MRNQKGHYVKEDELAKYSIKNPQKNEKDSAEETEDLARDSALLDALKDVKDAVESPDNLDPLIDSVKEVTAPLSATFDISKTVVGTQDVALASYLVLKIKSNVGAIAFLASSKNSPKTKKNLQTNKQAG